VRGFIIPPAEARKRAERRLHNGYHQKLILRLFPRLPVRSPNLGWANQKLASIDQHGCPGFCHGTIRKLTLTKLFPYPRFGFPHQTWSHMANLRGGDAFSGEMSSKSSRNKDLDVLALLSCFHMSTCNITLIRVLSSLFILNLPGSRWTWNTWNSDILRIILRILNSNRFSISIDASP
jgi:hypothetical protein